MELKFDKEELRPLVADIIQEVLRTLPSDDRIAWTETEAASICGVARHVLRDARLRGEVQNGQIGARIVYSRKQLLDFVESRDD